MSTFSVFSKSGYEPDRFTGKFIKSSDQFSMLFRMHEFSRYRSTVDHLTKIAYYPKIEISQKMDEFSSNTTVISEKRLDEFFRNCQ